MGKEVSIPELSVESSVIYLPDAPVRDINVQITQDRDSFLSQYNPAYYSPNRNVADKFKVQLFRRYAAGYQDLVLTDNQKRILDGILGHEFSDNVCHQIIAESADRIKLLRFDVSSEENDPMKDPGIRDYTIPGDKTTTGIPVIDPLAEKAKNDKMAMMIANGMNPAEAMGSMDAQDPMNADSMTGDSSPGDEPGENTPASSVDDSLSTPEARWLNKWFVESNLEDKSGQAHYDTLRDGDFAVSLVWDPVKQRVKCYLEPWWDGFQGIFIGYDDNGDMLYAVKEWPDFDGTRRRVVWMEGSIRRFKSDGAGWTEVFLTSDILRGTMAYTRRDGTPLPPPVVHFTNSARGSTLYGVSELDGGVIGHQDQLNDLQYALSAVGRLTGYQQLFFSGISDTYDEQGNLVEPQVGPGVIHRTENADARAQTLPAGEIKPMIDLYLQKLKSLCRMCRVPLHAIIGAEWPSGEALLRAEMPAIQKAERQISKFQVCWATLGHRAMEIYNAFGPGGLNEDRTIRAVFAAPERRDALSMSFILRNLGGNLSQHEIIRASGKSPEQANDVYAEYLNEYEDKLKLDSKYNARLGPDKTGINNAATAAGASTKPGDSPPENNAPPPDPSKSPTMGQENKNSPKGM